MGRWTGWLIGPPSYAHWVLGGKKRAHDSGQSLVGSSDGTETQAATNRNGQKRPFCCMKLCILLCGCSF